MMKTLLLSALLLFSAVPMVNANNNPSDPCFRAMKAMTPNDECFMEQGGYAGFVERMKELNGPGSKNICAHIYNDLSLYTDCLSTAAKASTLGYNTAVENLPSATRNGCFHTEQSMNPNEDCFWDQGGYAGWVRTMKKLMIENGKNPKDSLDWKRMCLDLTFAEVGDPVPLADCEEIRQTAVKLGYID